jgi:hypothetical protein
MYTNNKARRPRVRPPKRTLCGVDFKGQFAKLSEIAVAFGGVLKKL